MPENVTVKALITKGTSWNMTLLREHFSESDIQRILKIKLPSCASTDSVLWHFDKKRIYSVKSGYHLALQLQESKIPSSSRGSTPCPWHII